MMKRLLALCLALLVAVTIFALPEAEAAGTTATVKGGWLRLRAEPSFQAATITSVPTGTVVNVLGSSGEWYHTSLKDGTTGYMYGQYLTINAGSGSIASGVGATVISQNGLGVRLRTGPSTAYGVIGLFNVGTRATVISQGSYWHYVRIGTYTGYMMSQYLALDGASATTPTNSYTAYVTSENGLGVRLRKGPGTGYGIRGVYNVGTQVTVLEHGKTWCYIRIGDRTGYMMTKFLTTSQASYKVTGVTLNTAFPVIGQVLTANVTPSSATVKYEWLDSRGTLLTTGTQYVIQASDVGRQIRVRVTGTGSFTGTAVSAYATVQQSGSSAAQKTAITAVTLSNTAPTVGQTITASANPSGATANYVWYRDDGVTLGTGNTYTVTDADAGHALYCAAYATGDYTGNVASYYTSKVQKLPVQEPDKAFSGVAVLPASCKIGQNLVAGINVNSDDYTIYWYVDGRELGRGSLMTITPDLAGKSITVVVKANDGSGYTGSVTSNGCSVEKMPSSSGVATPTDL